MTPDSKMSDVEVRERRACAEAMLAAGIDEAELNLWDIGAAKNDSLDGFMEGWLARAKRQQFIPVLAIEVATGALQVFLDAIDGEMAESAVKSALLVNDRVNTAQQISTLREFLRQVKGEKNCADCGLEYCECYLPAWNAASERGSV